MPTAPSAHPVAPLASLLLPRANPQTRALLDTSDLEFTFNARGALGAVFQECRRDGRTKVLVPAYHCPSAISPVIAAGLEPVFYRIKRDLSIDYDDLLAKAGASACAVLVIHFFGIAPDLAPLAALRHGGVKIVEDCSHSFLLGAPLRLAGSPDSDYRIYSFWKIVPSGVGGGLWRRTPLSPGLAAPHRPQARLGVRLRYYKRLFEESVAHSEWSILKAAFSGVERARLALKAPAIQPPPRPPTLEQGEHYYDADPHLAASGMPGHAVRVLMSSDLAAITARRQVNFLRFVAHAQRLAPMHPLVTSLPPGCCPWVFPVLLDNRAQFDTRIRAAGVPLHSFGTLLHSALFQRGDSAAIADARYLAQHMLCLSVHQDLAPADIDRSVQIIETQMPQTVSS